MSITAALAFIGVLLSFMSIALTLVLFIVSDLRARVMRLEGQQFSGGNHGLA